MADAEERTFSVEDEPWWKWRFETLCKAGYPPDYAIALAHDRHGVDLHLAVDLVKRCGVEKAYAILY